MYQRDRNEDIQMLEETLQIMEQGYYSFQGKKVPLKLSKEEREEAMVFLPDEVESFAHRKDFVPSVREGECFHNCENLDSFAMARKRLTLLRSAGEESPKVLVHNLASPVHPGGGVRKGSRAQEEELCRNSSLLLSLESKDAKRYYDYNKSLPTYMGSDAIIISPKVEIIRDEEGNLLPETEVVSVITCAAPNLRYGKEGMSEIAYQAMVAKRLLGMLQCSAYYGYDHLVLGAWGCGAYHNEASDMADLFNRVLKNINYNGGKEKDLFKTIDFAVLDRRPNLYNFRSFAKHFSS